MIRTQSSLGRGVRPVRALFEEKHLAGRVEWRCRLCDYLYYEITPADDWPVSVYGLLALVKHVRGHTAP